MSDDRPTRPSRPRTSIPQFTPAPTSHPFAVVSRTLVTVDRIVRSHVEASATLTIADVPVLVVASRESDLVRLVVRMVADAALTLAIPRRHDSAIVVDVETDLRAVTFVVEVRGGLEPTSTDVDPTLTSLAETASALVHIQDDGDGTKRLIAHVPLAIPIDRQDIS